MEISEIGLEILDSDSIIQMLPIYPNVHDT